MERMDKKFNTTHKATIPSSQTNKYAYKLMT